MSEKFTGVFLDYIGITDLGFAFSIADDSPNHFMAARLDKMFEENRQVRMKIVEIEEIKN